MLVANRKNGVRLSLGDQWDKKELIAIRSKEKFHCPECKEEVIMKLGSKKIWHFSHLSGNSCEHQYERESNYHLAGKLQLYNWLKNQGINAELEKFDPSARQKPDIAFDWQGKKYAIEFQCSIIPEEIFIKRTASYFKNGYIPIWIAAGNLIKRTGSKAVSINNFLYLFIRRPHQYWNIPAYCPLSGQFIDLNGAIPISSRKTITQLEIHSIDKVPVNHLISPVSKSYPVLTSWQSELKKFKSRYLMYPGSYQNHFLQQLYRNHLNLLSLPSEIGLPVFSGPYIETPALIWQTYLYLDLFRNIKKGDVISLSKVHNAFNNRVKRGQIKWRNLPLAGKGDYSLAVTEYIQILTKISVLTKVSDSLFKLNRELKISDTIDEQSADEAYFYKRYGNIIEAALLKINFLEAAKN
ncbi:MAG: competence protein CoiA family protein [Mesobacillus sp.]|uniref:competence protein CoiA n=1 Tax=Mesobacillus sp. TaxID=2675271 RepID=UPI003C4DA21C